VLSNWGQDLQVWDIQAQKLDVQRYTPNRVVLILQVLVLRIDQQIQNVFKVRHQRQHMFTEGRHPLIYLIFKPM